MAGIGMANSGQRLGKRSFDSIQVPAVGHRTARQRRGFRASACGFAGCALCTKSPIQDSSHEQGPHVFPWYDLAFAARRLRAPTVARCLSLLSCCALWSVLGP
jgi:hypothetical protein